MSGPAHLRSRQPRVAIVADSMTQRGGAERCIEAFAEAFPDAPIYCIVYSAVTGPTSLESRVIPSWLDRIPGARKRHRLFFPLFPSAVESFPLENFDVILSSHHSAAKGVIRSADQVHVCYCHTPMRVLWERSNAELRTLPGFVRPLAGLLLSGLRIWDYCAAARVDVFVANGRVTQRRIAKHYGRSSLILNPPIDVERFTPGSSVGDYYLVASRPVPYKRIDIAIEAAEMTGRPLYVVGGYKPTRAHSPNIRILGHVSDAELIDLMRGAKALLFPPDEDFGMTVLEMNACGRPVIAFGAGGALESVIDGKTGILVEEQSARAFAAAIERFETMHFEPSMLRLHAEQYSRSAFIASIQRIVSNAYRGTNRRHYDETDLHSLVAVH